MFVATVLRARDAVLQEQCLTRFGICTQWESKARLQIDWANIVVVLTGVREVREARLQLEGQVSNEVADER